ncbi:hypothetical protein [Streptococcus oralis]|nr:hypothetical protein [Streptococcus oralis]
MTQLLEWLINQVISNLTLGRVSDLYGAGVYTKDQLKAIIAELS